MTFKFHGLPPMAVCGENGAERPIVRSGDDLAMLHIEGEGYRYDERIISGAAKNLGEDLFPSFSGILPRYYPRI